MLIIIIIYGSVHHLDINLHTRQITINVSVNVDSKPRVPGVIIIGASKCGTSALRNFLNQHPSIVAKLGDEMQYFGGDYHRGREWLRSIMPPSEPNQITLAKSAGYIYNSAIPERIHIFNSSMKLILILRDPVVRAVSMYGQKVAQAKTDNKSLSSFESMVLKHGTSDINEESDFIKSGIYSFYIAHWLKYFPRRQLLILDGDMLINDPYLELHKVEDFLGITHYFTRDCFHFNEEKGFFCRIDRKGKEICMGDHKGRKHVEISADLKKKLIDFLKPYDKHLYNVTGEMFSWFSKYDSCVKYEESVGLV